MSGEVECRAQSTEHRPVVHQDIGFPEAGGREADILDVAVLRGVPPHVRVRPLLDIPSYRNVEGKICLEISIFNIGYLKQQHIDCRNTWQTGIFRYYLFLHFMVWF